MFLGKESFARKFTESLVRKVQVPQYDGYVYIKKLGFADRCRFKTLCIELNNKLNVKSIFSFDESVEERKKQQSSFIWAEEFLIQKCLCEDESGSSYFHDMEDYLNWREKLDNDIAEFLIGEIREFNGLYKKNDTIKDMKEQEEAEEEDLKAKKKL